MPRVSGRSSVARRKAHRTHRRQTIKIKTLEQELAELERDAVEHEREGLKRPKTSQIKISIPKKRKGKRITGTTRTVKRVQARQPSFTTVVTDVISARGRPTFAAGPQAGQPQTAQNILLSSTAIAAYRYDESRELLRITFVKGGTYDYFGVPLFTVLALGRATSKGRYFYYNIRTSYNFERIR